MGATRIRITLSGTVQGVGMRPHIAKIAYRHRLCGWCRNDVHGVTIEWQGPPREVASASSRLIAELPPLAEVTRRSVALREPLREEDRFTIVPSRGGGDASEVQIPPDVATCPECLTEFHDPANPRYRYPFINCTNCGPRHSIITSLPYDRASTTMASFPLCPRCAAEYSDPLDRRYHAEPIACPDCGPRLWLSRGTRTVVGVDAVAKAVRRLWDEGLTVAVKGIGGFHLTCDATNGSAIARLRIRKNRPAKPFAVMVPDLDWLRRLVDPGDENLFLGPAHPIVVAPSRGRLPKEIAPGLDTVGVMLPYSPLHELLVDRPIVATSGNSTGEPICTDNDAALHKLSSIADAFVLHDRGIHLPVDDFVVSATGTPIRRSRGFAPAPIDSPWSARTPILAVGGELKNTFCLLRGRRAHVSAHIGDMGSLATQSVFERGVTELLSLRGDRPTTIACDAHPGYATSAWAERMAERHGTRLVEVQHHHAHAASLLADRRVDAAAAIATLDGTGYGSDATIWGGEVLDLPDGPRSFYRAWHLPSFELAGGDRAARSPWRCAVGVASAWGLDYPRPRDIDPTEFDLVSRQVREHHLTTTTTSAGRLFDAAAAMIGVAPPTTSYEGQAACELETLARRGTDPGILNIREALAARSLETADRARAFHRALAHEVAAALLATGRDTVGITGGCALNRILVADLAEELARHGVRLLTHRLVPPTDGGLSFGQAVVAASGGGAQIR